MNLYVNFYDENLTDLHGKKFKVLSVYKKCINLTFGRDRLVTILLSDGGIYDFAADRIIINANKYPDLKFTKFLSTAENNAVWNHKCLSLTLGNNTLNFYFTYAKKYQLENYKKLMLRKTNFLNFYSNLVGINRLLHSRISSKEIILAEDKIFSAIRKNNRILIEKYIADFIGMGEGSTPEFDDFLSGIIFMMDVYTYLFDNKEHIYSMLNTIKMCCKKNLYKTTFLSRVFLSHIISQRWSMKMIELINGLCSSDIQKIDHCAQLILNDGVTSGKTFLYAMVKTAEVLHEKYY